MSFTEYLRTVFHPRSPSLRTWLLVGVAGLLGPWLAFSACADTFKLDAVTTGFYTDGWAFRDHPLNVGYAPWADNSGGPVHNNYLIFDLASVAGFQINSATLRIRNLNYNYSFLPSPYCPDAGYGGCPIGYISPDPSETYALWDVTTPVSRLLYGSPDDAYTYSTFIDLGSGIQFGSTEVTQANTGAGTQGNVDVQLNADGLSYLNAAVSAGDFTRAFGGSITTLAANGYQELVFAGSGPYTSYPGATRRLILDVTPLATVPVPGAYALLLSALGVLGAMRRRGTA